MITLFADTSVIAKRYLVTEIGSMWVKNLILPSSGNLVIVAETATTEMLSLLNRRQREGGISAADLTAFSSNVLLDIQNEYLIIRLDTGIISQTHLLVNKYPLKALDAIQLSSALTAQRLFNAPLMFISADKTLLAAAKAEGFVTDDPNLYP